ncbi:gamma-type small acid-soluble spore protein [Pontibacillus litoralis]|uniref:Small, acid-soluble spore protein gamma-type n=1 Tax=Pontibacillus litoralis JSM 072002 TaxID=1385512 RepID=A0A0A5HWW1_9BACI|nr:gamma-type small acid-soluble spore protein [Pontibacillus litoralis]KGX88117.1 gamma-type small, acid-soluble spore protein [Pontibacillus litoralis JSM 072002]
MAKKQKMNQQANQTASGTNINHVKQQNQQSAQGQGQYGTEFGQQQTDAQHVKQQNQKSAQKKNQQQNQQQQ